MNGNKRIYYEGKLYLLDGNEFKRLYNEGNIDKNKILCPHCKEKVIISFGNTKRNDFPIYFRHTKSSKSVDCPYNSNNKEYGFEFSKVSKNNYKKNKEYIISNYDTIFKQIVTYIWIGTKSYVNYLDGNIYSALHTIKEQGKLDKSIDLYDIARIIIAHMEKIKTKEGKSYSVFFKDNTNKKYRKYLIFDEGNDDDNTVKYISSERLKLTNSRPYGKEKVIDLLN